MGERKTLRKRRSGQLGEFDIAQARDRFGALAELGIDLVIVDLPDPFDDGVFDYLGELIEEVSPLGRPAPSALRQVQPVA